MAAARDVRLSVNSQDRVVHADPATPLLYILRNDFGLNGPKYGCGLGECGSCTVLIDGRPARSCVQTLAVAEGHEVTTLEGLERDGRLHPVQEAFIEAQAAQCGYCLNGMIMMTCALLEHDPEPTDETIRGYLRYNLCRCGAHYEILDAVQRAARRMAEAR